MHGSARRTDGPIDPEQLELLAAISPQWECELRRRQRQAAEAKRQQELQEFVDAITGPDYPGLDRAPTTEEVQEFVEAITGTPSRAAIDEFVSAITGPETIDVHEGNWDSSQHPRAPKGQPDGGRWVANGEASSSRSAGAPSGSSRTTALHAGQASAHLVAVGGAQSATWPTIGPMSSLLPKVGSGVGAGAAAGIGAGAFLGGLSNASMGAYWARVPAVRAMPQIWVYEIENRVRAGKLSREDAIGIFNTAVLGAEAQGFKPTGGTMSAVHQSAKNFLGKAEAVYFARKKKASAPRASLPGAYEQSGGRVFPTKRNSGLDGYALRQEQERFFERGLSQGKPPEELRGQAKEAGLERVGRIGQPDRLEDPEVEAALQRAVQKVRNNTRDNK